MSALTSMTLKLLVYCATNRTKPLPNKLKPKSQLTFQLAPHSRTVLPTTKSALHSPQKRAPYRPQPEPPQIIESGAVSGRRPPHHGPPTDGELRPLTSRRPHAHPEPAPPVMSRGPHRRTPSGLINWAGGARADGRRRH